MNKNKLIMQLEFDKFISFYNRSNGAICHIDKQYLSYKEQILQHNNFFRAYPVLGYFPKITIGLNITSKCNFNCSYCFNKNKNENDLTYEEAVNFIDNIINITPHAQKYFVDMAGSGEPLLKMSLILKIADYCKIKSDKIEKEIIPMLATNGFLLNEKIVTKLQEHSVLFGISIDGYQEYHDHFRKSANGEKTFENIMNNFAKIKCNEYVGSAMTYSTEDVDIFKAYSFLLTNFKTVAIRPARRDYHTFNFENIINGYKRLVQYFIDKAKNNSVDDILKIVNGDDYFGRYIIKILSQSYTNMRCDAGYARFSLGNDHKIYGCSGGINIDKMVIPFPKEKKFEENINNDKIDNCFFCDFKNLCGGECYIMIENKWYSNEFCQFKYKLIKLAFALCGELFVNYNSLYQTLYHHIVIIVMRLYKDEQFEKLYQIYKDKYTFTELKNIKDHDSLEYLRLIQLTLQNCNE